MERKLGKLKVNPLSDKRIEWSNRINAEKDIEKKKQLIKEFEAWKSKK